LLRVNRVQTNGKILNTRIANAIKTSTLSVSCRTIFLFLRVTLFFCSCFKEEIESDKQTEIIQRG
ncbi:hypothetical protein, partial [Candidatus Venteria ishoeyi]|uniref:hypothetical protein n=1 Tax=Candidatus Venteria ishoeyi TaxID=1899563 RepID=UPI00255CDDCA